jgi:NAD(P)-dependent dehydrogenase (short-subunit alcohol dehydrogenase family)
MVGRLEGKTALITGGSSGIGLATARIFLEEGAKVAITGTRPGSIDQAKSELKGHEKNLITIQADLGDESDIEKTIATVKENFSKLDVLFLNHGVAEPKPFEETEAAHIARVFNINFTGPYLTLQKAVPLFNNPASVIINASISGSSGMPGQTVYGATKAAIRSLARTASTELMGKGIRVNAVSPGVIETPILGKQGLDEEGIKKFEDEYKQNAPAGRCGKPEDIGYTVLFLASDESQFIVGEEIIVDGGFKTT